MGADSKSEPQRLKRSARRAFWSRFRAQRGHLEWADGLGDAAPWVEGVAVSKVDDTWLSVGMLAVGVDGYRALVSYGEIAPGSGNRGATLAVEQGRAPPARPRLVVTGEVTGGRDVNDVVESDVVRVGPTG